MSAISPIAQQAFKELKQANADLLRAMARQKRARAGLTTAEAGLREAKRRVELLLQAVQPELPEADLLDHAAAQEGLEAARSAQQELP